MQSEWALLGSLMGVAIVAVMVGLELNRIRARVSAMERQLSDRMDELRTQRIQLRQSVFVQAAQSAEEATRALVAWTNLLTEHATSVVFDPDESGFRPSVTQHDEQRVAVQRAGLFLPPELDRQFHRVIKTAVNVVTAIAMAQRKASKDERRDLCKPAVQAMDKDLHVFLNTTRVWKKRNWFEITTGETPPETLNEITSPNIMKPRGLLTDSDPPDPTR